MNDGGWEVAGPEGRSPVAIWAGTQFRAACPDRPGPFRVPRPIYQAPLIVDRGSLNELTRAGFDEFVRSRGE